MPRHPLSVYAPVRFIKNLKNFKNLNLSVRVVF